MCIRDSNHAQFSKDERNTNLTDVEMIKNWLFKYGYSINSENNDFHKVLKIKKSLKYYGGIGFSTCSELGNYEVQTEIESKKFTKLSDAKSFYDKIEGEKAFWNLKSQQLIDAWYSK